MLCWMLCCLESDVLANSKIPVLQVLWRAPFDAVAANWTKWTVMANLSNAAPHPPTHGGGQGQTHPLMDVELPKTGAFAAAAAAAGQKLVVTLVSSILLYPNRSHAKHIQPSSIPPNPPRIRVAPALHRHPPPPSHPTFSSNPKRITQFLLPWLERRLLLAFGPGREQQPELFPVPPRLGALGSRSTSRQPLRADRLGLDRHAGRQVGDHPVQRLGGYSGRV